VRSLLGDCPGAMRDIARARELLESRTPGECGPHCRETRLSLLVTEACVLLREGRSAEAGVVMKQVIEQEPRWKDGPVEYRERWTSRRAKRSAYQLWGALVKA